MSKKSIAVFPGSFDPITKGHLDIIERASRLFDKTYVVILVNSEKKSLFSTQERVTMIQSVTEGLPGVEICSYSGLTIDFCREHGAGILLRGLRNEGDYAYEYPIACANRAAGGIETLFLPCDQGLSAISSTIVREFASYGGDITSFLPPAIVPLVEEKIKTTRANR